MVVVLAMNFSNSCSWKLLRFAVTASAFLLAMCLRAQSSSWTPRNAGTTANLWGATYAPDAGSLIVAVGEQGTILASADDGATWIRRDSGTGAWLTSVTYETNLRRFFAVGEGGIILASADGIVWTREQSPTGARLNTVVPGRVGGTVSVVGEAGAGLLIRGLDGVWTRTDAGFGDRWLRGVAMPYAFGQGGAAFLQSGDGANPPWTSLAVPTSADFEAAVISPITAGFGSSVIAVGSGGVIAQRVSADFVLRSSGTTERLRGICYRGGGSVTLVTLTLRVSLGEYFAVGSNGVILRSADGATWQPDSSPARNNLNQVIAAGKTVIAFGDGGTILQTGGAASSPTLVRPTAIGYDSQERSYIEALAAGDGALTYLWVQLTQGAPWSVGTDQPRQLLPAPLFAQSGPPLYQLIVGNAFGLVRSEVVPGNRLYNLSARAVVGAGEKKLIGGFAVAGEPASARRAILVRAVGPALANFGLPNALKVPRLTVFSGQNVVATNTGWSSNSDLPGIVSATARAGAFPLAGTSADSVLLLSLPPGNYTAQIESADGTSGVALLEIYDADAPTTFTRLGNLSARADVQSADGILIGGLVINGGLKKKLLLRASGPALSAFGLQGVLAKPKLTLYRGSNVIGSASEWSTAVNAADLRAAAKAVGAFAFPEGSADAALLVELAPGAYTLQVTGADGSTGVALVEAYELL